MADVEPATTTERIQAAEETLARAQTALERAQAGLRAAEEVSETADRMRAHPVRLALGAIGLLTLVALLVGLLRGSGSGD